ncbi:MAG: hypothetical protein GF331_00170 [Chitinivibrionales bacterium]|nr:hypothetical protein [Chitinivibrionales bacterium]
MSRHLGDPHLPTHLGWPGTSTVATGNTFDFSNYTNQPFIRAVLDGSSGDSFTQPFGFQTN